MDTRVAVASGLSSREHSQCRPFRLVPITLHTHARAVTEVTKKCDGDPFLLENISAETGLGVEGGPGLFQYRRWSAVLGGRPKSAQVAPRDSGSATRWKHIKRSKMRHFADPSRDKLRAKKSPAAVESSLQAVAHCRVPSKLLRANHLRTWREGRDACRTMTRRKLKRIQSL